MRIKSKTDKNFTHISKWLKVIDSLQGPRVNPEMINFAKEIKSHRMSAINDEYLCHADLHLDNILQHGDNWLAIDPKGIIGPKEFELAAFDIINKDEKIEQNVITKRLANLAEISKVEYKQLLNWYFVRSMISAQWFIEDGGDPTFKIKLSEEFYQIIKNNNLWLE